MYEIEIIDGTRRSDFKTKLNKFLANEKRNLIDIKYNVTGLHHNGSFDRNYYSALIIFED